MEDKNVLRLLVINVINEIITLILPATTASDRAVAEEISRGLMEMFHNLDADRFERYLRFLGRTVERKGAPSWGSYLTYRAGFRTTWTQSMK